MLRAAAVVAAAALAPAVASADPAVTTQGVNMRAGPDVSYPQVAFLGRGLRVDVVGCAEGWQWCDVVAGPNRGWVYAGYLAYTYDNRPTVISYAGPSLGIPLVSFSIGPYWDNYYRGRPFWNNRSYWYSHRVARAPEWRAPAGWHGNDHRNDWRGNDNRYRNDWRDNDHGRGNGRGNGNGHGNEDRRAANQQGPQGDGFHAEQN